MFFYVIMLSAKKNSFILTLKNALNITITLKHKVQKVKHQKTIAP